MDSGVMQPESRADWKILVEKTSEQLVPAEQRTWGAYANARVAVCPRKKKKI